MAGGGRETRRVFLIGDAFVPPHVGGENDCFGVLRIRGGQLQPGTGCAGGSGKKWPENFFR